MFGYDPSYVAGAFIGGIIGIYLFSHLFRYALLGRSGTKLQVMWVVLLTGIVAIGFAAFGDGTGGFANRITNQPNIVQVTTYSLAALVVAFLVWLRTDETPPAPEAPQKRGIVGRAVALVWVIPLILVGLGNIGGSVYSLAVNGPPPGPGLGVSRAEFREVMLNGKLAPFWQLVDERAPSDLDYIIERMFANEDAINSVESGQKLLIAEMVKYRVSLATYGPALTDVQRKEIIGSSLDMLRRVEDQRKLCVDIAATGGQNLSQQELLSVQDELNRALVIMTGNLLDAKEAAAVGAQVQRPPTEQDYKTLIIAVYAAGMTEDQLQAVFDQDAEHPEFCSAIIQWMDGVVAMDGPAGEAVRFEAAQAMLSAAP